MLFARKLFPLILFSAESSFKSCLMLSCTIFKIQKNVVGGSETMYVRVLNDINETYRG